MPTPWFKIYPDERGEWRWTLYAANNRKIADSAEGYQQPRDCFHGLSLVKKFAASARVVPPDGFKTMAHFIRLGAA
jgi:uncharacterized protein YegP (UPF0339 family)